MRRPGRPQKVRDRVRQILLEARSLGDNSNVTNMALEVLSRPDTTKFHIRIFKRPMRPSRTEKRHSSAESMDAAIAAYRRALDADPHLYHAALFAGDAEFKKGYNSTDPQFRAVHFDAAGCGFAKALSRLIRMPKRLIAIGATPSTRKARRTKPVTNSSMRSSLNLTAAARMWV